jgi:hypothetical protein
MAIANITGNILTDSGVATSSLLPLTGGTLTGTLTVNNEGITINRGAGNGYLLFQTNGTDVGSIYSTTGGGVRLRNATSDVLTLNSSGNVGIGTSSPASKLQVEGGELRVTTSNSGVAMYQSGGGGEIASYNWGGSAYTNLNYVALSHTFGTSGTERMRIPANGGLLIKQAVNNFGYEFRIANTLTNEWSFINGSDNQLYFGYNSSSRAVISQTTGNYTALSDINKKKDFEESNIGLFEILCLKPTFYRMIDEEETSNKHLGFIAQEVKEFIPQAYYESKIGEEIFIGLQDRPIIAALVKAIQELEAKVSALESKI